ncbi:MAG: PEP-CTERM sorting domain-containing protein [Pseudomonadota bacterium]
MKTMLAVLALGAPLAAQAAITLNVSFVDPGNQAAAYRAQITSHLDAAAADWGSKIAAGGTLDVQVRISSNLPYASGHSETSAWVGDIPSMSLWQQGAAYKLATGDDVNGDAPDVILDLNPNYMANQLWFDPNPAARTAAVPNNKTDAMSVFIHELGHALAFNGWSDHHTGATYGYGSTWDQYVSFNGSNLFFNGPQAMAVYGGPVPITTGNNFHFGNPNGAGADLVNDLFNGWVFYNGQRYGITALDEAVLADTGLALAAPVPEPAQAGMLLLGLAGLVLTSRAKARRLPSPN